MITDATKIYFHRVRNIVSFATVRRNSHKKGKLSPYPSLTPERSGAVFRESYLNSGDQPQKDNTLFIDYRL